jgi:hypothetical protein
MKHRMYPSLFTRITEDNGLGRLYCVKIPEGLIHSISAPDRYLR